MTPQEERRYWWQLAERLATPVLTALAERELHARMPLEFGKGERSRHAVAALEVFGRLLAGIAPWLAGEGGEPEEQEARRRLRALIHPALEAAVDPESPDRMNFTELRQPVVDASFLALGLLRGWSALWEPLPENLRGRLVESFRATRVIRPGRNNWLLFAAMIETFLRATGDRSWDRMRVDYALQQHEQWYVGDGVYSDGAVYHWDYYNSFVIQPYLLEILDRVADEEEGWPELRAKVRPRAARYAVIQERMIAADGSFPVVGRSICYRAGAFHHLATMAWREELPKALPPGQIRAALTTVQRYLMDAPGTWDHDGWLRIGWRGHQPSLAERYINTGSLYLCSFALLPLGLSPSAPFWSEPAQPWTAQRLAAGEDLPNDHAL